jgi:hypothetical protein
MSGKGLNVFCVSLGVLLSATAAFADAIDGDWCHKDGRRFSIRGSQIVTPAGKHIEGDYSRHWFNYVVPAPEPGTGKTVFMQLLDENTVQSRLGDANAGDSETWIRCSPTTSGLPSGPPA